MPSFWRKFRHWLWPNLSFRHLQIQPVTNFVNMTILPRMKINRICHVQQLKLMHTIYIFKWFHNVKLSRVHFLIKQFINLPYRSKNGIPWNSLQRLTRIREWINNHEHYLMWDIITKSRPNINGDLAKQPLRLGHGRVITSHCIAWIWLLIHTVNKADSRLAPSQWETSLQRNAVPHWLGANLESVLPKLWWWC